MNCKVTAHLLQGLSWLLFTQLEKTEAGATHSDMLMWIAEARQPSARRLLRVLEGFKYVPVKIKGIC